MKSEDNNFISAGRGSFGEDIFKNIFEKNPLPMWLVDSQTMGFLLVNQAAIKKYGYTEEEFMSLTLLDICSIKDKKFFLEYYKRTIEGNQLSAQHEVWGHKKKNGELFFVETAANKVVMNGKNAIAIAIADVTDSEKAKRELAESEERFRLLAESSLEGIVLSENKIIVDASEQFVKMFGYENLDEVLGKNIEEMVHPDDRKNVDKKLQEKNAEPYEIACFKKDGTPILVKSKGHTIPYHGRHIRISVLSDITRQKEDEENLKKSEERYRRLFENNLAAVFRTEIGGEIMEFNKAFAAIFGYSTTEEVKKLKAQDLYFTSDDRQGYVDDLHKNGFVKNYQMRMKKKDGSEIWILENVALAKNAETGKTFIEGTLIDITETKRVELALQEREKNYRSLIEHSPDGILIHDKKGETLYANPAALNMMGIASIDAVAEKNLFNYVMPEYHNALRKRKTEMNKSIEAPFMEIKILRPDEKIIEVEIKANRITYHGEQAVEVVMHDISIHRQLEKERIRYQLEEEANRELKREIAAHIRTRQRMNANQKYIRLLIDSSLDMIFACDQKGKITEFNHAAQHIFGYALEEIMDKNISVLYADKEYAEKINDLIFEDGNFIGEVKHLRKDGETFPAYLSAAILKNNQGEIIGSMGISRDITRVKETEEQLRKSIHEKEILLKEIHHRVKNNLQVISSILKLQSAYVKDKKTIALLSECRNRISSMAFIHATLYLTKDFANVNFAEYVGNIASNLQQSYKIPDRKILLRIDIPKIHLHIDDAIPCGLIINELLTNSFKYAFAKKKKGTVCILVKVKKENIILAIWDNGGGIPKSVNYRKTESLGLQLVISLVEQIGGKIKMESKKDKGTKYIIAFHKSR